MKCISMVQNFHYIHKIEEEKELGGGREGGTISILILRSNIFEHTLTKTIFTYLPRTPPHCLAHKKPGFNLF